jgi:transketolase
MTYRERIDEHIKTIQKQVGNISLVMDPHYAKITIDGETHAIFEEDVVVAVEAYLWGIITGYALALQWAKKTIKGNLQEEPQTNKDNEITL